jgi:hypothetical protein
MRRRVWTRVLLAGALLALACVSDQNPLPTQPPQFSTVAPYPACDSRYVTLITSLINTLFPSTPNPSLRNAALSQFSSVIKQCSKNPADAQNKAVRLAGFTTEKFLSDKLTTTDWGNVSPLIDYLYQYVGLTAPAISADAVGPGGAVAVVTPTDPPTVVTTGDDQAGVSIPTGAISQTQTVLLTITPDPAGLNFFPNTSHFEEFQPFYNYQTFPEVPVFHEKVLVGICVDLTEVPFEQAHRLQLAHPNHSEVAALEILARVDAGFLPCDSYVHAGSDAVNLAQAGRTPLVSRLAQQALALFRPQALHAATTLLPGGLGGETGNFSDFRAIDPGKLVFTQQPSNTQAGSSITPAPEITVEREDGTTITDDPGNVTVVIGTNPSGGTLSGTNTVSTGSTGVATFPGLSIDNPGTGYTLFAASDTTDAGAVPQPVTSAAFDITPLSALIVDTIVSTASLDGWVQSDGFANADRGGPGTGDLDSRAAGGLGERQFYSFDLSSLPPTAQVTSAVVRLFQATVIGSPYGSLGNVVVDHLDYGTSLDGSDYNLAALLADVGTLSTDAVIQYKTLDVTARVQADRSAGRPRSQFRLRFSIRDSNNNGVDDDALFGDAELSCCLIDSLPQLVVTYH